MIGLSFKTKSYLCSAMQSTLLLCYFSLTLSLNRGTVCSRPNLIVSGRQCLSSVMILATLLNPNDCFASDNKLRNLPVNEISSIVRDDIVKRQALASADFTRSIYSEDCIFQDEIDKYPIDKYVSGTKALFNTEKSHVDLVGNVEATDKEVSFRFDEILAFNIPFTPKVSVSGVVKLSRDSDGLINYSREYWDQSIVNVLKTVKF